jgi:hypothetical protein
MWTGFQDSHAVLYGLALQWEGLVMQISFKLT